MVTAAGWITVARTRASRPGGSAAVCDGSRGNDDIRVTDAAAASVAFVSNPAIMPPG
jgi:hypothetical protein